MERLRPHGIGRIATTYGLILGVLSFVIFLAGPVGGIRRNWVASVASAILLIVLMVLAHWNLKKSHHGMMTYAQGLGSGTLLSSIGAVLRCILVYVYLQYFNSGYLAAVMRAQRTALERRGITGAQAQMAMSITSALTTPVGIAVTSLVTGVVAGFIVALIVSIFTQRDDPRAVI
ncbi:MAG: DUF4199 domain-containing protein [Steroidobacteraceae bacterium]